MTYSIRILAVLVLLAVAPQANRTQVPQFEPDPLWSQSLPNKWVTGQVGGLAVDSHDNLWVFHRPATIPDGEKAASLSPPQAECCIPAPACAAVRAPPGDFLQAWGGVQSNAPTGLRMVRDPSTASSSTTKDNVWLSGSAKEDNQILKFTNTGKFLLQIGHAGKNQRQQRYPRTSAARPACSFIRKTNELFVADGYFNRRVIVFDADTGAYKTALGRVRQSGRTTI